MGYYTRIVGVNDSPIKLDDIKKLFLAKKIDVKIDIVEGSDNSWEVIDIFNKSNDIILRVESNCVEEGSLAKEELNEFREDISTAKPASAVTWLNTYFNKVKIIYTFQFFSKTLEDDNYEIVDALRTYIWNNAGGIFQADDEGFSNEEGYHILWQFNDNVTGNWNMAVLDNKGKWVTFCMDLGDIEQRKCFFAGQVPKSTSKRWWNKFSIFS
jgi:hypothetical protein